MMSRHKGTKARRRAGRRAFSLTEVLLAVFILGIGVIAVAALFPAGIAQQQQSADDVIGPIVANNALSILRTKLRSDDFGTFEEHGVGPPIPSTIEGDWPWLRPAFIFPMSTFRDGAIDIFNSSVPPPADVSEESAGNSPLPSGIPYSRLKYGAAPKVVFTQAERFYPISAGTLPPPVDQPIGTPQYVWDCMFRRFQGKVLVAIFVYRVTIPGGGRVPYTVPRLPSPYDNDPPLPLRLALDPSDSNSPAGLSLVVAEGMWDADGIALIEGTADAASYDATDLLQSWQEPRQWLLDQNNNMHRVLSRSQSAVAASSAMQVELVRPVPGLPGVGVYYFPVSSNLVDDVVSHLWYVPAEVKLDVDSDGTPDDLGAQLTPVYATVKEL